MYKKILLEKEVTFSRGVKRGTSLHTMLVLKIYHKEVIWTMTNAKSTKRALLVSLLAMLLCMSMLVGTTFAWFTDSVTSGANRITAGTLKVDLLMDKAKDGNYASIANGTGDIFSADGNGANWEPGKTEIVYLAVENKGSLALKYDFRLNTTDEGLVGALEYAILDGVTAADTVDVEDWTALKALAGTKYGELKAGMLTVSTGNMLLAPDTDDATSDHIEYIALAIHMSDDAGNEYKEKSVAIDVTVQATQATMESDSFGDYYDDLATYPNGAYVIPTWSASATADETGAFAFATDNGSIEITGSAASGTEVTASVESTNVTHSVFNTVSSNGKTVTAYDIKVDGYTEGTEVTVKIFVGKALSEVVLYHEGVEMPEGSYSYDALNGYLTFTTDSFSVYDVAYAEVGILPLARVEALTPEEIAAIDGEYELDTAYRFTAKETAEEAAASRYAMWHADFVVTFDQNVEAGSLVLAGQYDSWSENWVFIPVPDIDSEDDEVNGVKAGEPVRLLKYAADFLNKDVYINYKELCESVIVFSCGAGDVEDANVGTKITVELRLYETVPQDETDINSANVETGNYRTVGVYSYIFGQ